MFTLQPIIGLLLALMLLAGEAASAGIRVFSGGAPQEALRRLAPEFEQATGHRLEFTFQLVTEIQRKLAAGEKADVILLPVSLIAATEKTMPLRTEGRIVLARVGIGVIVRSGTTPPDISTSEAVRRMLLGARAIAWSDPGTPVGAHLDRMLAQLGIADEVRPKLVIRAAIQGGAALVASGEADFGLYLVSEVQTAKGITLAGLLPSPLQSFVVYGTAVPTYNAAPEAAVAFVKFISDPSRGERWKAAGFELLASAETCDAKYGDVVAFDQCNPVALPGVNVRFVGISQPHKGVPLLCWNYEAYLPGSEKAAFQHCHTGALGGEASFRVADKSFTVVFDTSTGCARLPVGSWAPRSRGHSFLAGVLDSAAIEGVRRKEMQAEEECFARPSSRTP